jgi:hypothetical protein
LLKDEVKDIKEVQEVKEKRAGVFAGPLSFQEQTQKNGVE